MMPELIQKTLNLSDGRKMKVKVPDYWTDAQISDWATQQLGAGAQDPRSEAVGPMNAVGLGAQRTASEIGATGQDIGNLASRLYGGELGTPNPEREALIAEQAEKQRLFEEQTREQPAAAAIGQGLPLLMAGVGGSPASAMMRGAAAGGSLFEENPMNRALNAAAGGAANRLGFNALGRVANRAGMDTLAARTQRMGMVAPPEVRGPVIAPGAVQATSRFAKSAEGFSDTNQRVITEEALRMLGQSGSRFRSDTFQKADKEYKGLLSKALNTRSNIHLGGFKRHMDRMISDQRGQIADDPGTVRLLQRWRDNLDKDGRKDFLTPKEYQEFRSQLGMKAESFKKKPQKKVAIRELIEDLDDAAMMSLPPKSMKAFRDGRQLWRSVQLLKAPNLLNDNGQVVPKNLARALTRKDESRFLFRRGEQPRLMDMLRTDIDIPIGQKGSRPGVTGRMSEGGGGLIVTNPLGFAGYPMVGAARLPTRAIEGAPLGLTAPNVPTLESLLNPQE